MSGIRKLISRIDAAHEAFKQYNQSNPGKRFHIIKTHTTTNNGYVLIDEFGVYDHTTKKYILSPLNHLKAEDAVEEMEELAKASALAER